MKNVVMNSFMQTFFLIFASVCLGQISRSGISELNTHVILPDIANFSAINGCSILHFYKKYIKVSTFQQPHQKSVVKLLKILPTL